MSDQIQTPVLTALTSRFLDPETTDDERRALRRAASTPERKFAYEQHYVDRADTDDPLIVIRHTLAALFMTTGFTNRESARQIVAELRELAEAHHLDFAALYEEVSMLPGARRSQRVRRLFALGNVGLFAALIIGTIIVHQVTTPPLQIVLQLALLVGVVAGQILLLYRHLS
jgi:hypothetical protein